MYSNRGRKITNNIMIFTIGNFGSRILMFLMVLVYTHYIDAASLGYYDLIISTINLASPLALMAFTDGIYRWLIDSDSNNTKYRNRIIATCNKAVLATSSVFSIIFVIFGNIYHVKFYIEIAILFISIVFYQLNLETVRGLSSNRLYAISGLCNSTLCLLFEIYGLVVLKGGIIILLFARIIANGITLVLICLSQSDIRKSFFTPFDKDIFKDILLFSLPLIPNMISWWVVNSSDRYIVVAVLGAAANGIYSVANKFPTIVTVITGIVHMALQEVIIKEYSAEDRDFFYSRLFEKYYVFLFSMIMCAVPVTKVVILLFVSEEYKTAWIYLGFLYLSTIFSALSSFYGVGYTIAKDTKRSVKSTVFAAFSNIVVNLLLIRIIGLHAASFSTFAAYLILFLIRVYHSKKYFEVCVKWFKFVFMMLATVFAIALSYFCNLYVNVVISIFFLFGFIFVNKSLILSLIKRR